MPPKKGKKDVKPAAPLIPRDLSEPNPLDGRDGILGIDNLEVQERVREVQEDLIDWKLSDVMRSGSLELDFREQGLDALPDGLYDLQWLQVLDLSRNLLVNAVFDELKDVANLRAIDLTSNLLASTLPDSFGSLNSKLEELCLDENVIERLPATAANLSALSWVSLRRNLLAELPGSILGAWRKLVHLDLRDNKLKALPEEVGLCASLETLMLTGNELTDLPEALRGCTALLELHVQRNQLTALPLGLGACGALQLLDVTSNKLTELPGGVLAGLGSLRTLFAGGNKITAVPVEVAALRELEVLSLSGNAIKALPDEVGALVHLREIYLANCPISALPPSVVGWTELEQAVFKNCKLKALPAGVEAAWSRTRLLDFRQKKKPICKVGEDIRDIMKRTRMLGVTFVKPKKKGKK